MPRDETDRSRTCQDAGVANRRNRGDGKLRRHRVLCASLAKQYRHRVRCTKSDQHQTQHGDHGDRCEQHDPVAHERQQAAPKHGLTITNSSHHPIAGEPPCGHRNSEDTISKARLIGCQQSLAGKEQRTPVENSPLRQEGNRGE